MATVAVATAALSTAATLFCHNTNSNAAAVVYITTALVTDKVTTVRDKVSGLGNPCSCQ